MQLTREMNGPVEAGGSKINAYLARFPWKIFSVTFAAAYLVIVCYFGVVNPASMLGYFLGQIAFTLIPGMAMGAWLSVSGEKVKFLIISYFLGIFINIIFYMVFYLAHLQDFLLYGMIAVSALSVYGLYKKRSYIKSMPTNNAGGAALSIVTAICLYMLLSYTIFNDFAPNVSPHPEYYHDMLWNTGNLTALYLQFPPQDIHNLGISFNYNYLYSMFLAVYKNLFGISSFDLNFKLFAITQILLFTSSVYLLFQKFIKNMAWVAAAIMLVLFADGTLFAHIMWAAFTTTFGLVFCALTVYFFFRYAENMETAKLRDKNFWLMVLFFGMASFAKSTFALVLLAGIGVALLCQLFRKKNISVTLLNGIVIIAVMGLAYEAVYVNVYGFNGLSRLLVAPMVDANPAYFQWAMQNWSASLSPTLIKLLCYPVFLATQYTTVTTAFFVLLIAIIKWRREDIKKELFLFSSIILGVILASVTTQPGGSNILFIMICQPLALLAIAMVFKRYFAIADARPLLRRALCIAVCALVGLSTVFSVRGIAAASLDRFKSYPPLAYTDQPIVKDASEYNGISRLEYEGMIWLRDNTPKNAIVAGDRIYYTPSEVLNDARYFYYTAFSERQFYLEGYEYTNTSEKDYEQIINNKLDILRRAYQNNLDAIAELKAAGVTYLVRTDYIHSGFRLDPQYGKVVFENQSMTIYQFN